MTLKSRLTVTQDHWKRNHWVDDTWLTISRVIWRWILSWPWNVTQGQTSLEVTKIGTIWKLAYGFVFAFHSNYGCIISHFGDIQRQIRSDLEIWVWGRSTSLKMAGFDRPCMTFYWSAIVTIALSCTVFELLDVEYYRELEKITQGHWNWCRSKAWVWFPIRIL